MKNLEMFEMKKTNLNFIYGGKKKKMSEGSGSTENCTWTSEDGFNDVNNNGVQDCGENNYSYKEWDCCGDGGGAA